MTTLTISKKTAAITAAVATGIAALIAFPTSASGEEAPTTEQGKAFAQHWEADNIAAEKMMIEAEGQMITLIDKDTNTEVIYNTTLGNGINRTEYNTITAEGYTVTILEEADGASFDVSREFITVEAGDHGTFSVPRLQVES